jgi:hypothetical protein
MPDIVMTRLHADGTLDLDHYRRRAARLQHLVQRRAWRAARVLIRRLAFAFPIARWIAPAVAQDCRGRPWLVEGRANGEILRIIQLDPLTAAAVLRP